MLNAEIIIKKNINDLKQLFGAEEKVFKNQRAGYEVIKEKNKLVFKVKARDSTALKAVLNSITKLISVYEKAERVIKRK